MSEPIEIQRKKLIYRSLHRGTKEMDCLLGKFAQSELPSMSADELDQYAQIMEEEDPNLYNWITKQQDVPLDKQSNMLDRIKSFHNF